MSIWLSGCSIQVNNSEASTASSSLSTNAVSALPTASVLSPPTDTPGPYATCQLAASGHNARITVAGPGVSNAACTGLLSALANSSGGWVSVGSPPLVLPTVGVICVVPQSLLPSGSSGVVTDSGEFHTSYGNAACAALAAAQNGSNACPSPFSGQISGSENRIPLQIEIAGPNGTEQENAILDTGAATTVLPDSDLQTSGFTSSGTEEITVGGWSGTVNVYSLPAADLLVLDDGRYVPLATGTLSVVGAPPATFVGGIPILIGPNVLQQGAQVSTNGSTWTLAPGCAQ